MAMNKFCFFCQQFDVDHESIWCPQIKCRQCGDYGHTLLHCGANFQTFPFPDEIILKIFGFLSGPDLGNCAQVSTKWNRITLDRELHCGSLQGKVHIFWEGHKVFQNLHQLFDWKYIGQIIGGDFPRFCGLLRIYELYKGSLANATYGSAKKKH